MLIFYSFLTIYGIKYIQKENISDEKIDFKSVDILIPCYNEGLVISNTLEAMISINYPGELNIYVLDDNSTDDTAKIALKYASVYPKIKYLLVPPIQKDNEAKGKSRVLNFGIRNSKSYYFLVYDADNIPEKDAVTELVRKAQTEKDACGAVGYIKTINANKNILTRMISIEFQIFQTIMQSGRWSMLEIGTLAGTNMLLKRSIIDEVGEYDTYALAEDSELTMRIASKGYRIPVTNKAISWEQEPENIKVLLKQRTRWMLGNIYLIEKAIKMVNYKNWNTQIIFATIQHLLTYVVYALILLFSNVIMVLGLVGILDIYLNAPLIFFWYMAYIIYTIQLLMSLNINSNINTENVLVGFFMYFSYAQIFILLLIKCSIIYIISRIRKSVIGWDKTERVKIED